MKMRLAATVVATILLAGVAHAADLAQPAPLMDAPEVTVQETSGWYLRGDVGYSFNKLRGAEYFQGSNDNRVDFDDAEMKDSFSLGMGVGYQVNSYLRTDLTFDYLTKSDFNGSTSGECGVGIACTSRDVASLKAYYLMANAYVDLGTYGLFTPYVGAGIGGGYVKWGNLRNTICDDPAAGGDCYGSDHDGKSKWRLAYQFMAGTAIDLTCNLKADVGYRFRHTLAGDMFGYEDNGGPGSDKGFYSHEARIGARYMFNNNCEAPVAYEPAPMVYK